MYYGGPLRVKLTVCVDLCGVNRAEETGLEAAVPRLSPRIAYSRPDGWELDGDACCRSPASGS